MIKNLPTSNKQRVNRDNHHQVHMRTRRKILNNPRPTMLIFSSGHWTRKPLLSIIRITGRGNHAIQLLTSNRAISYFKILTHTIFIFFVIRQSCQAFALIEADLAQRSIKILSFQVSKSTSFFAINYLLTVCINNQRATNQNTPQFPKPTNN